MSRRRPPPPHQPPLFMRPPGSRQNAPRQESFPTFRGKRSQSANRYQPPPPVPSHPVYCAYPPLHRPLGYVGFLRPPPDPLQIPPRQESGVMASGHRRPRSCSRQRVQKTQDQEKPVVDFERSGVVVNYNQAEGFGFIIVDEKPNTSTYEKNIFVHNSGLLTKALTMGDTVNFDVARGRKGLEAINVTHLEPMRVGKDHWSSGSRTTQTDLGRNDRRGEVIEYDVVKRFGIIKCFGDGVTLIGHHSRFKPPLSNLRTGQVLKFNIVEGPKGDCADAIEVLVDRPSTSTDTEATQKLEEKISVDIESLKLQQEKLSADMKALTDIESMKLQEKLNDGMEALKLQEKKISAELECCLCLELLAEDAVITRCDHSFCRKCILHWLQESRTCPQCRSRVVETELKPVPRMVKNLIQLQKERE